MSEDEDVVTDGFGRVKAHERLARVEEGQNSLKDSVDRIEVKVDDLRESIEEVDEASLSRSRWEREAQPTIEQWDKYLTVVKWAAGAVILLAAIVQIMMFAGVNVFA